jgi:hypothetical protein
MKAKRPWAGRKEAPGGRHSEGTTAVGPLGNVEVAA